jgi:hypothetical protein
MEDSTNPHTNGTLTNCNGEIQKGLLTILMLRKSKLIHKENIMKISCFCVTRKYFEFHHCHLITNICIGYFQSGLKPFSCSVKISYATKVIE